MYRLKLDTSRTRAFRAASRTNYISNTYCHAISAGRNIVGGKHAVTDIESRSLVQIKVFGTFALPNAGDPNLPKAPYPKSTLF